MHCNATDAPPKNKKMTPKKAASFENNYEEVRTSKKMFALEERNDRRRWW